MTTAFTAPAVTNRPTEFQVGVTINGTTQVVGYSARRTKASLAEFARASAELVLGALAADEDPTPTYSAKWGWQFGPVRVHFTGNTRIHP